MVILLIDLSLLVMIALLCVLFVTQVILPLQRGTPLFPQFRKATSIKREVDTAEKQLEEDTELWLLKQKLLEINRRKLTMENKDVDN